MPIEAEIRSFISKEKHDELLEFFKNNSKFVKEDYQETFYFDTKQDLRIQKNNFYSKVWLKKGNIHDSHREEIEVKFDKNDFEKLEALFLAMGLNISIKWFRARHEFEWKGITVCIDFTKGYGHIIEFEKMCEDKEKELVVEELKQKLESLNIPLTPKEEFDKKFKHYKENWKTLTK